MSSTVSPAIQGIIHRTLGAVYIGFAVACVVYGILITQVFHYFRGYPLDRSVFKITVLVLVLLETTDQALMGHIAYYYAIANYGQWAILLKASMLWSPVSQITIGAVVGAIVKTYFALRVWRFSGRNFYITGLILLLTFAQLGLAISYSIRAFMLPSLFAAHRLQILGSISLGTGVLTDVVTAATLCFFLNRLRTGHKTSDSLVTMLCNYAINTGILTSTVSVATLVLYNAMPENNLYFLATYFILSKLYAISFMATLNTRRQVRGRGTEQQHGDTTNHTNMFHLGTRVPSMGPSEYDQWDKFTPVSTARGRSALLEVPQVTYAKDEFPYNSFHPGTGLQKDSVGRAF